MVLGFCAKVHASLTKINLLSDSPFSVEISFLCAVIQLYCSQVTSKVQLGNKLANLFVDLGILEVVRVIIFILQAKLKVILSDCFT